MSVATGLDRLATGDSPIPADDPVALVCHPASVDRRLRHAIDVVRDAGLRLVSLLGPEHGIDAAAQDMEVVEGEQRDAVVPTYNLYGDEFESLRPRAEQFHDAKWLVCDLQDVGARYYTYVWTMMLAAEVALDAGMRVLILDRPNPLGGVDDWVEGGLIAAGEESFVGLHSVCTRHGMTVGELLQMSLEERGVAGLDRFEVLRCTGWTRDMLFGDTGLPWVLPSPNMPTMDTALVYPGQCLFEGTKLSEGRGTTRPFELFGAPWVDGDALARALSPEEHPGLAVRPCAFKPMFQKHANDGCAGLQLHVQDPAAVRSVRTSWALLRELHRQDPGAFEWRTERYEFVDDRPAIDLLAGGPWLRQAVEAGVSTEQMLASQEAERLAFIERRRRFLLY